MAGGRSCRGSGSCSRLGTGASRFPFPPETLCGSRLPCSGWETGNQDLPRASGSRPRGAAVHLREKPGFAGDVPRSRVPLRPTGPHPDLGLRASALVCFILQQSVQKVLLLKHLKSETLVGEGEMRWFILLFQAVRHGHQEGAPRCPSPVPRAVFPPGFPWTPPHVMLTGVSSARCRASCPRSVLGSRSVPVGPALGSAVVAVLVPAGPAPAVAPLRDWSPAPGRRVESCAGP